MPRCGTRKDENGGEQGYGGDRRQSRRRPSPNGATSPLASLARVPLRTRNCRLRRGVGEHAEQSVNRVGTPRPPPLTRETTMDILYSSVAGFDVHLRSIYVSVRRVAASGA